MVIGTGLFYLAEHPDKFSHWADRVENGQWYLEHRPVANTGFLSVVVISLLLFPRLALGLSGFETGVAVMPVVKGDEREDPKNPSGRIRNTRRLLVTAAAVMSVYLLSSSLVVSTIIEPRDLVTYDASGLALPDTGKKPPAADRALAYLAHGEGPEKIAPFCGPVFGTAYDIATVVILWFAGASAMAGLLNLVPQYLPRYGMAPEWARALRPLVILFTIINLGVTWIFDASVKLQSDAYATGVLVLITSACVATVIDRWRKRADRSWIVRVPWGFGLITAVFVYTTSDVIIGKPAGIKIASFFIVSILVTSIVSRIARARELRFQGFNLPDTKSRLLWDTIKHLGLSVLVPHRPGRRSLESKEATIRLEHRIRWRCPCSTTSSRRPPTSSVPRTRNGAICRPPCPAGSSSVRVAGRRWRAASAPVIRATTPGSSNGCRRTLFWVSLVQEHFSRQQLAQGFRDSHHVLQLLEAARDPILVQRMQTKDPLTRRVLKRMAGATPETFVNFQIERYLKHAARMAEPTTDFVREFLRNEIATRKQEDADLKQRKQTILKRIDALRLQIDIAQLDHATVEALRKKQEPAFLREYHAWQALNLPMQISPRFNQTQLLENGKVKEVTKDRDDLNERITTALAYLRGQRIDGVEMFGNYLRVTEATGLDVVPVIKEQKRRALTPPDVLPNNRYFEPRYGPIARNEENNQGDPQTRRQRVANVLEEAAPSYVAR